MNFHGVVDWLTLVGLAVASRAVCSPARSYGLVVCLAWSARRWLGGHAVDYLRMVTGDDGKAVVAMEQFVQVVFMAWWTS